MPLLYQIAYIFCGFMTLALGLGFYWKQPKSAAVQAFAALTVASAFWIISLFVFYISNDPVDVLLYGRVNFASAAIVAAAACFFAYLFPRKSYAVPRWLRSLVILETALLVVATVTTGLIDENEVIRGVSRLTVKGPFYWWFGLHFVVLSGVAVVSLAQKYHRFGQGLREQILILVAGLSSSLVIGGLTNIFIPRVLGNEEVSRLGPLCVIPFVASAAFAVARHELFNMRILAAEFLVSCLMLASVINVILTPVKDVRWFVAFTAGFVLVMGFYLITNVRREVSERDQLDAVNRDLAFANGQLKEMDNIKNEFIIMASHQLRTPITVVKGYLSLMMEGAYGAVPEHFKDKLAQMFSLNERLVQMIDNMLNVARIEKRKIEYQIERVDILPIARTVSEDMRVKLGEKKLKISLEMPEQPVMAYVDEEKFEEVLTNLIDNAIKYTDTGEIAMRVRDDDGTGFVTVTVRDSGMGMSPEEAGRVFTKFFRAKEAVIREPGTGLGLYICAKFMSGMGGQISVLETATGFGTTFETRLPTRQHDPNLPLN